MTIAIFLFVFSLAARAANAEASGGETLRNQTPRPSILVILVDTLRRDAVSSYGHVDDTTLEIDRLAEEGLRFDRAFAPAPWTLPSHATLFTGKRIDQHRVGMPGLPTLPGEIPTLAERLRDAGYETAAFSENPVVSDVFELLRGFEVRNASYLDDRQQQVFIDAPEVLKKWLGTRDTSRPFFAFVNLFDAHSPYSIRKKNPWVPAEATSRDVKDRPDHPEHLLCGGLPTPLQRKILKGLYLGDVNDADRKVGTILSAIRAAEIPRPLITIVTSDHGELFGEDQIMGHEFSLHSGLLSIPLIVHGLPGAVPRALEAEVGLEDLMPSILEWAGVDPPNGMNGKVLPRAPIDEAIRTDETDSPESQRDQSQGRRMFSAYSDRYVMLADGLDVEANSRFKAWLRQFCTEKNRVFGGMASILRYPFKFVWYERYPARLFDLSWDPQERSDVARHHPDMMKRFEEEIAPLLESSKILGSGEADDSINPEILESLRALGYIE